MIHKPLFKAMLAAILPYFLMLFLHYKLLHVAFVFSIGWFLWGLLYTHFFEYFFHRVPMHKGLKFFRSIKISHMHHHQTFYGDYFQSRYPPSLEKITMKWYNFPILLSIHYVLALMILPPTTILVFFAGVVCHFLMYESSHWFTHVKDNFLDRKMIHWPFIGRVRRYQISHHKIHHETPIVNFNFNVPPLGDFIFQTYSHKPHKAKTLR